MNTGLGFGIRQVNRTFYLVVQLDGGSVDMCCGCWWRRLTWGEYRLGVCVRTAWGCHELGVQDNGVDG